MRFLIFSFFIFLSFSVSANCAPPIELLLEIDETQEGRVILQYSEYSAVNSIDKPSGLIFRARRLNDEWADIHEFEIVDVEGTDEYFIAAEECVPPGEWTYIIPYDCYEFACNCSNYNTIVIPEYFSDCVNSSNISNITSEEFQNMKKCESDAYPTDDDYYDSEYPDEDEVLDEVETENDIEITDEFLDESSVDNFVENSDEAEMDEGNLPNDEDQNEDKTDNETSTDNDLDDEAQGVEKIDENDGCSLVVI